MLPIRHGWADRRQECNDVTSHGVRQSVGRIQKVFMTQALFWKLRVLAMCGRTTAQTLVQTTGFDAGSHPMLGGLLLQNVPDVVPRLPYHR